MAKMHEGSPRPRFGMVDVCFENDDLSSQSDSRCYARQKPMGTTINGMHRYNKQDHSMMIRILTAWNILNPASLLIHDS